MRQETKIIKDFLHKKFPDKAFSVSLRRASNYIDYGDKVLIKTEVPFKEMVTALREIVKHMSIYRKGGMGETYLSFCDSEIVGCDSKKCMVDFIEIDTPN